MFRQEGCGGRCKAWLVVGVRSSPLRLLRGVQGVLLLGVLGAGAEWWALRALGAPMPQPGVPLHHHCNPIVMRGGQSGGHARS